MSLLTKSQATRAKGKTRAARANARRRANRAAAPAGPLTASARASARKGIYHARTWTAPRLDRTGHTLQDQVAPRMAAALSATAAYLLKRRATARAPEFSATADAATTTMPTDAPSNLAASDVNGRVRTG